MLHSFERRRAARRLCRKKNLALHLIKLPDEMPPLGWAKLIPGLVMSTKPSRFTVTLSRVDGVRSGAALSTRNTRWSVCSGCAQGVLRVCVGRCAMQCGGAAATHFAARCAGSGSLLFLPFFAPAAGSACLRRLALSGSPFPSSLRRLPARLASAPPLSAPDLALVVRLASRGAAGPWGTGGSFFCLPQVCF